MTEAHEEGVTKLFSVKRGTWEFGFDLNMDYDLLERMMLMPHGICLPPQGFFYIIF